MKPYLINLVKNYYKRIINIEKEEEKDNGGNNKSLTFITLQDQNCSNNLWYLDVVVAGSLSALKTQMHCASFSESVD